MKTIIVASQNPVKIDAAQRGFERMFPGAAFNVKTVSVPSGVSDQPMSSQETLRGALNRTCAAAHLQPRLITGLESKAGLRKSMANWKPLPGWSFNTAGAPPKAEREPLCCPRLWQPWCAKGRNWRADDIVFQRSNSKQANGAIGLLTADALNRTEYYEQAVILALVVFRNPELYPAG